MEWILLIVFIVVLVCVACLAFNNAENFKSRNRGKEGEVLVAKVLSKLDGKFINNYIFLDRFDKSHQIDHIFISRRGVFIIETKNYSGMIFGKENQENWVQVLAYGNVKNKFYNPVKQNETHYKMIKALIRFKYIPIYSCVVFVHGDLTGVEAEDVFNLDYLHDFIEEKPIKISESQVDMIYNFLDDKRAKEISDDEHSASVRNMLDNIENNICPICGGKLVKKEGSYGEFYGCSNYPKCKFSKHGDNKEDEI